VFENNNIIYKMSIKHSVISQTTLSEMSREEMKEWTIKRKVSTKPQMRGMSKEELFNHIVNRPKFVEFEIDEEFEDLLPPGRPVDRLTKADERTIRRMERPPLPSRRKKTKRSRRPPQPRGTPEERGKRFDKLFGTGIGKSALDKIKRNRRLP
jgi:hypothetical protein